MTRKVERNEALGYLRQLEPNLVPIAAPSPGICCESCRSGVGDIYARCFPCNENGTPAVLPISLSLHGSALHRRLRRYKDAPTEEERREHSLVLAVLLGYFLQRHEGCLGDTPDFLVTVPSRDRDALEAIINKLPRLRAKRIEALRASGTSATPQFELVAPQVEDRSVLLLDDTFTRGRNIAAAHRALVSGGASIIGPLVIGRHFHSDFPLNVGLWSCLKDRRWSLDRCGLCSPIDCQAGAVPQPML